MTLLKLHVYIKRYIKRLFQVFHPNIDPETGAVCLNIIRLDWKPVLSVKAIVFGLILLLNEPSSEDPLDKSMNMSYSF